MSKPMNNQDHRSAWDAPAPAGVPNVRLMMIVACVITAAVAAFLGVFIVRPVSQGPAAAPVATSAHAVSETLTVEFEKLKGKWLRPDGGYVIEIKRLLDQNALEAAYYNPNPIHVGKAKLYKERGFVKVFIELQDVNYPGSTYTLIYDAANDQLRGTYYQAVEQVEYQIAFERMPPGN